MESGLVQHCVFEVDGVCVAGELHIVTNCADTQFQLPLRPLNHRAAWFRICLYHLNTSICVCLWLVNCYCKLSLQNLFSTCVPYSSQVAVFVFPKSAVSHSATALSSVGRPSLPLPLVAAGTPPDKLYISLAGS